MSRDVAKSGANPLNGRKAAQDFKLHPTVTLAAVLVMVGLAGCLMAGEYGDLGGATITMTIGG